MENRIFVRKGLTLTFHLVRTFCNLVTGHPFVLGILFFLILLYRVLPSLFHFLVSPVFVCTALLLGTILSFGDQNYIPEFEVDDEEEKVEEEEKKSENTQYENSSLLAGEIVQDDPLIPKDESFCVETHAENIKETDEVALEDDSQWVFIATEGEKLISDGTVLKEKESKEIHDRKQDIHEEKGLDNLELIEDREFNEIVLLDGGVSGACEYNIGVQTSDGWNKKIEDREVVVLLDGGVPGACETDIDVQTSDGGNKKNEDPEVVVLLDGGVSGACENDIEFQTSEGGSRKIEDLEGVRLFDSSQNSPSSNEIELSESDSSTNRGESSSSDPFMEDLTTMLEELQPLLDAQPTQPALMSLSDSDAESEQTLETTDSSIDSEEEGWNLVGRECGRHIVVTWTEEDEKNFVRDLLISDLESERIARIEHAGCHVEQESDSSDESELVEIDQRKKIDIYSEVGRSISRLQAIQSSTSTHSGSDFGQFNEEEVEQYSYLELINGVSLLEETGVGPAEFILPKNIDLAFKQTHEGRFEKPVVLEPICENSVFNETKFGSAKFLPPDQDEVARPLKSINIGPKLEDTIVEATGLWLSNEDHVILELPGLESRTPELCVGGHEKPPFADSVASEEHSEGSRENILKPISESEHWLEEINLPTTVLSQSSMDNVPKSSESEQRVDDIYLGSQEHSEGNMENIPKLSECELGVDEVILSPKEHSECSMKIIPKAYESENGVYDIYTNEHSEGSLKNIPKASESENGMDAILANKVAHLKVVESGFEDSNTLEIGPSLEE